MKVNKSYSKRLRITKNKKVMSRASGQNHFNAKLSGRKRLSHRRAKQFILKPKTLAKYLGN